MTLSLPLIEIIYTCLAIMIKSANKMRPQFPINCSHNENI